MQRAAEGSGSTGRKTSDIDYNDNLTQYAYNPLTGDLIQVNDAGTLTQLEYDRFGNLARLTDPVGNATVFERDALQRLVRTASLGHTIRVLEAAGSTNDIVVRFSEPIDIAAVGNGTDVTVRNAGGTLMPGTSAFSADGTTLTWTAVAASLIPDTYKITLRASSLVLAANWSTGSSLVSCPAATMCRGATLSTHGSLTTTATTPCTRPPLRFRSARQGSLNSSATPIGSPSTCNKAAGSASKSPSDRSRRR